LWLSVHVVWFLFLIYGPRGIICLLILVTWLLFPIFLMDLAFLSAFGLTLTLRCWTSFIKLLKWPSTWLRAHVVP